MSTDIKNREQGIGPFIPLSKWAFHFQYPSQGAMKSYAYHRRTNGFKSCYILIRKKAYIDLPKFQEWMRSHAQTSE